MEEKSLLLDTFPGRYSEADSEIKPMIVVEKLFDVRFTEKLSKVYTKVHIGDNDEDDVAQDACGYTGNLHRERPNEKELTPI